MTSPDSRYLLSAPQHTLFPALRLFQFLLALYSKRNCPDARAGGGLVPPVAHRSDATPPLLLQARGVHRVWRYLHQTAGQEPGQQGEQAERHGIAAAAGAPCCRRPQLFKGGVGGLRKDMSRL